MRKYLDYFSIVPKFYPLYYLNLTLSHYDNTLIPIIRYQKGMHGYLTTRKNDKEWCGTFYYFEPDSEYLLKTPKTLITWNKITAYLYIGIPIDIVYDLLYNVMNKRVTFDKNDNELEIYPSLIGFNVVGNSKEEQWLNVIK